MCTHSQFNLASTFHSCIAVIQLKWSIHAIYFFLFMYSHASSRGLFIRKIVWLLVNDCTNCSTCNRGIWVLVVRWRGTLLGWPRANLDRNELLPTEHARSGAQTWIVRIKQNCDSLVAQPQMVAKLWWSLSAASLRLASGPIQSQQTMECLCKFSSWALQRPLFVRSAHTQYSCWRIAKKSCTFGIALLISVVQALPTSSAERAGKLRRIVRWS